MRRLEVNLNHMPKESMNFYSQYYLLSMNIIKVLCLLNCQGQSRIELGLLECLLRILCFPCAIKCTQQGFKLYMLQQNSIKSFLKKAL